MHQRHLPQTKETILYNVIDKVRRKQNRKTCVTVATVGGQTNTSERMTGTFRLWQRNERGDTLVDWATSEKHQMMNTQFQKKSGRRWTWRSPVGNTKNETDYNVTNKQSMVTDRIRTDPRRSTTYKVAMAVEAALREMKNETEAGKYQVNFEHWMQEMTTIAKDPATLNGKWITEWRIRKAWKEAKKLIWCYFSRKATEKAS